MNTDMAISTQKLRLDSVPPKIWLLLLTCLCLLPFVNKAVHIDDTLFLRAAQQIQKHPLDFYGFQMNWFGYSRPMVENFDNPPLTCYYIALVTAIGGWSEPVLHLAFLLPALLAAWGTYSLACKLCSRPLLASTLTILMPVFLISATTLMCDVMLLAFWIWSLVWFERGLETGSRAEFVVSGALAGLAFWTKFPGITVVPLLAFWGFSIRRRAGWWLVAVALPFVFVAAYEWSTFHMYGKGLLFTAMGVAAQAPHRGGLWEKEFVGLSFFGGCCVPVWLFLPRLWSFRRVVLGICLLAPCLLLYPYLGRFALLWKPDGYPNWPLVLQSALFIAGGLHLLLLAAADFWDRRDPAALVLTLWVFGVFVFATSLNWTTNGRSLLLAVPAIGILVARRLDYAAQRRKPAVAASGPASAPAPAGESPERAALRRHEQPAWREFWPLLPAAALSLFLVQVDYNLASAGRTAANALCRRYQTPGKMLWFEGHWGFQYYMEQNHARALERPFLNAAPGEYVIVPSEAANTFDISTDLVRMIAILDIRPNRRWATMSLSAGAGFYAAICGPFPFSLGSIDPERYYVLEVTQSLESAAKAPGGVSSVGAIRQQLYRERQTLAQQTRAKPALN